MLPVRARARGMGVCVGARPCAARPRTPLALAFRVGIPSAPAPGSQMRTQCSRMRVWRTRAAERRRLAARAYVAGAGLRAVPRWSALPHTAPTACGCVYEIVQWVRRLDADAEARVPTMPSLAALRSPSPRCASNGRQPQPLTRTHHQHTTTATSRTPARIPLRQSQLPRVRPR